MATICGLRTLHNNMSLVIAQKYRTQIDALDLYVSGVCLSVFVQLLTSDNMMLGSIQGLWPTRSHTLDVAQSLWPADRMPSSHRR
jgi:hypothetical protein